MPGFWFRYNMYALARNSWKFKNRDKRKKKEQHIEMDYLAPDTAEQMLKGMQILKAAIDRATNKQITEKQLLEDQNLDKELKITLDGIVNKGLAHLLKPAQGFRLYRMMIYYYASRELIRAVDSLLKQSAPVDPLKQIQTNFTEPARTWFNLGGQLVSEPDIIQLKEQIRSGEIKSWKEVHKAYDQIWEAYPLQRLNHAIFCLLYLEDRPIGDLNMDLFEKSAMHSVEIGRTLLEWTYESRSKDHTSPFRKMVYRNEDEMAAVLGSVDENSFIIEMKAETENYAEAVRNMLKSIKRTG